MQMKIYEEGNSELEKQELWKTMYTSEQQTKHDIYNFIYEGLKDVHNNNLYHMDEVFEELENT